MEHSITKKQWRILGIMSGTSCDGLDCAVVDFDFSNGVSFRIVATHFTPYTTDFQQRLKSAIDCSALEIKQLEHDFTLLSSAAAQPLVRLYSPDAIAAHGHTVFHQPQNGFTHQILNGALLAAGTNTTVVCDFRSGDVALGGQGAPLVPLGDSLLFSDFDVRLNLGGFSNISYETATGITLAYDVSAVNIVANALANQLGQEYDRDGALGAEGQVIPQLLEQLNALEYYQKNPPKSLGLEAVKATVWPILDAFSAADPKDLLRTFYEHIAQQIGTVLNPFTNCLATGGGTLNSFLIHRLQVHTSCTITIPSAEMIAFKEAIIFAFLGCRRLRHETTTLASVTGAARSISSGAIYLP